MRSLRCWGACAPELYEAQDSDWERVWWRWRISAALYGREQRRWKMTAVPADLCALRRQESGPILPMLHAWLVKEQAWRCDGGVRWARPSASALGQWRAPGRYLEDGDLRSTTTRRKQRLRQVALDGKRGWLAGSDEGGRRAAIIYTMTASCQQHGVEPWPTCATWAALSALAKPH
ncbi:transposase [bacterium]|nr:transposase [bacterium]